MPIQINTMLSQTSRPKIPLSALSLHREPGSLFVSFSSSGKNIFHAGSSPDKAYSYATPAKLRKVFSQKKISHVICLDARRVNLYSSARLSFSPAEPGTLRPENLLKFYKNIFIPCIHSYNGVNLALGDVFELEHTSRQFSNKKYSQLIKKLKQEPYRDFTCAVKSTNLHTHQHERYVENICKKHGVSSFEFNHLEFFPSTRQIEQFLNLMSVLIQHQKTPYIHCGSGTGRTAFHLMCIIIAMTNCTYYQALDLLSHNYSSDVPHEMRHYADYFSLYS
jgi:protein-tyrosine phosphatase